MDKNQAKKLLKIAALIYVASFLIINWNDVSWIFNYKEVGGLVSDFFNPYPSINATDMNAYFYPNHGASATSVPAGASQNLANVKTSITDKQNILEVPKLSLNLPIIFSSSTDTESLAKDLDAGVAYYPGSVYPGQTGQIIILGHSAPPGWPHIKHDWAFTDLDKLSPGDSIMIDLNGKQYAFVVKKTDIIKRGADVPTETSAINNNVLTLISCWPPGKDYQRIAVVAELQSM